MLTELHFFKLKELQGFAGGGRIVFVNPKIVFEDDYVIVLDKPSGWIANSSETTRGKLVVQNWLRENFNYDVSKSKEYRSGIVHRLDKETSGLMLIGKNVKVFRDLQGQFKKRCVEKAYTALVHGKVEPGSGSVKAPVGRLPWNRERFGVLPGGREAETHYNVVGFYKKDKNLYSLLRLKPKTGRTHQIRIHLKYLGYPIVSDSFYAGRKTSRSDREWSSRLFLHASYISFRHPVTKKKVEYKIGLAKDLLEAIKLLEEV